MSATAPSPASGDAAAAVEWSLGSGLDAQSLIDELVGEVSETAGLTAPAVSASASAVEGATHGGANGTDDAAEGAAEATSAAAAAASGDAAGAPAADDAVITLSVKTPAGETLSLPVSAADTVLAIRQLLADHPLACHHTTYHLELARPAEQPLIAVREAEAEAKGETGAEAASESAAADATEPGAASASASASVAGGRGAGKRKGAKAAKGVAFERVVLHDMRLLVDYADHGMGDGATIAVVPDAYDVRSARLHVMRLREVLANPMAPPPPPPPRAQAPGGPSEPVPSTAAAAAAADSAVPAAATNGSGSGAAAAAVSDEGAAAAQAKAKTAAEAKTAAKPGDDPVKPAASADVDVAEGDAAAEAKEPHGEGAAAAEAAESAVADTAGEAAWTPDSEADHDRLALEAARVAQARLQTVMRVLPTVDPRLSTVAGAVVDLRVLYKTPAAAMEDDVAATIASRGGTNAATGGSAAAGGATAAGSSSGSGGGHASSASGSEAAGAALAGAAAAACVKSVAYSGWNPPPSARRMLGDLFYLEVTTLEGDTLHVTATATGFFINSTRGSRFNPAPSHAPHHSHELVDLLRAVSPTFRRNYAAGMARAAAIAAIDALAPPQPVVVAPEPSSSRGRGSRGARSRGASANGGAVVADAASEATDRHADEGGADAAQGEQGERAWDALYHFALLPTSKPGPAGTPAAYGGGFAVRAPWLASPADGEIAPAALSPAAALSVAPPSAQHVFDPARAEESLLAISGADERSMGLLREWNDELQTYRAQPRATVRDAIQRSRTLTKTLMDFTDAATAGAVAVLQGHVAPLNPLEDERAQVFAHNNIFYSFACDSRDMYGARGGDEAAHSAANRDLRAVRELNRVDLEDGPHTLATAIVDYMGQRVVAQSVIPGILHGDKATSIVYGSTDNGATVAWDEEMHALMQRIGEHFCVATRTVTPLGLSEEAKEAAAAAAGSVLSSGGSDPVQLCGAVDCKGIRASDGRMYVLDLTRTTPVDANYLKPGMSADEVAAVVNTRQLRPECVRSYRQFLAVKNAREAAAKGAAASAPGSGDAADADTAAGEATGQAKRDAADTAAEGAGAGSSSGEAAEAGAAEPAAAAASPAAVPQLALNVNAFTPYCGASQTTEEREADERAVREVSDFLRDVLIPSFHRELAASGVEGLDGESLSSDMHMNGINMRYLGRLASLTTDQTQAGSAAADGAASLPPPNVLEVLETEMVARAVKHLFRRVMSSADVRAVPAPTLALLLSCVLGAPPGVAATSGGGGSGSSATRSPRDGSGMNGAASHSGKVAGAAAAPGRKGRKGRDARSGHIHGSRAAEAWGDDAAAAVSASPILERASAAANKLVKLTHEGVWAEIEAIVRDKYDYELRLWRSGGYVPGPEGDAEAVAASLAAAPDGDARAAALAAAYPRLARCHRGALLRGVCRKTGVVIACRSFAFDAAEPLRTSDVVDVLPVVKNCLPPHPSHEAAAFMEEARLHLSRGFLASAHDLAEEALLILYQVCGASHEDVASCFSLVALILAHSGNFAGALAYQRRALALMERLKGPDSVEAATAHGALANFYSRMRDPASAVAHFRRALYILSLAGGAGHHEVMTTHLKMGLLYQQWGQFLMAIHCFAATVELSVHNAAQSASCRHALAVAYGCGGLFREALRAERSALELYTARFGDKHFRTLESKEFVERFTQSAVSIQRAQRAVVQLEQRNRAAAAAEQEVRSLELSEKKAGARKQSKKRRGGKSKA